MGISTKELEFFINEKTFYKGVIENNRDPKNMGRVQVRLLGIHSSNLLLVPTETLPWANVIQPLSFGGFISGIGISSVPVQGTWVWCFVDFNDMNNIVVLGGISGINTEKIEAKTQGFIDPDYIYPLEETLNKPDFNTRGIEDYPNVHTIQTPGNHIIEINDATNEVTILHSNGSFIQLTDETIITDSKKTIQINAVGDVSVTTSGKLDIIASKAVTIQGSSVTLKSNNNTMVV